MGAADEGEVGAEGFSFSFSFSFKQAGPAAGNDSPSAGLATKHKDCWITLEPLRPRTADTPSILWNSRRPLQRRLRASSQLTIALLTRSTA